MTYDVQQLIEKCMICQEYGKSQPLIGTTQELPPFPWHTLATDLFYWKRVDFLIVADVFSKYIIVRKLPNSTSAAVCIELSMIVTESGSIASPLQLMTQHTPREKNLPQLPSALGAPEMHQTCQELIKRQGNKPERNYQELPPGTPVWVQHRQNSTWEPATVETNVH